MIPPRLAVIAHDKVLRVQKTPAPYSCRGCLPNVLVVRSTSPPCVPGSLCHVSHLRLARAGRSRLETLRQRATIPIELWVLYRHHLLKRRLRAYRRRSARPPRFLNRAGLKIVGAADDLRDTLSGKTRNELILS